MYRGLFLKLAQYLCSGPWVSRWEPRRADWYSCQGVSRGPNTLSFVISCYLLVSFLELCVWLNCGVLWSICDFCHHFVVTHRFFFFQFINHFIWFLSPEDFRREENRLLKKRWFMYIRYRGRLWLVVTGALWKSVNSKPLSLTLKSITQLLVFYLQAVLFFIYSMLVTNPWNWSNISHYLEQMFNMWTNWTNVKS